MAINDIAWNPILKRWQHLDEEQRVNRGYTIKPYYCNDTSSLALLITIQRQKDADAKHIKVQFNVDSESEGLQQLSTFMSNQDQRELVLKMPHSDASEPFQRLLEKLEQLEQLEQQIKPVDKHKARFPSTRILPKIRSYFLEHSVRATVWYGLCGLGLFFLLPLLSLQSIPAVIVLIVATDQFLVKQVVQDSLICRDAKKDTLYSCSVQFQHDIDPNEYIAHHFKLKGGGGEEAVTLAAANQTDFSAL